MKILCKDQLEEVRPKMAGGEGECTVHHILPADCAYGSGRLFAVNTLQPGNSIGYHKHQGEYEVYYILEGVGHVVEDGEEYDLAAGDMMQCRDGSSHSIEYRSDKPLRFLALIINVRDPA